MSDQSKKANQPKKGPSKKEEATRPVDGEASGSGGNSSTQNQSASTYTPTTSGGEGNTQETPKTPERVKAWMHEKEDSWDHLSRRGGNNYNVGASSSETVYPPELDLSSDEENENQPDDKDESKGNGKGTNV
ncbi:hypothetical protein FVEG_06306 [Fusarium verticillioides 7600]|uniref:Uncharacterized protein n=1 Tax=Gibberella moniliformis (strain M3125 / FGSC 7600) TaxID=334819 RepID=W7M1U1_GIBM7|nr:hypothetical protein FVEG_06306 [Fusarium verticillioides 7600]EWG45553.1 hypothetical protein FVEG_06306 [Fusarium verticillioides 7600]